MSGRRIRGFGDGVNIGAAYRPDMYIRDCLAELCPAVAEAYYRQIPLIVISADRPQEWIDQDDSQTIRQFRALDNIVKNSYDLPAFTSTDNLRWLEPYDKRCHPLRHRTSPRACAYQYTDR